MNSAQKSNAAVLPKGMKITAEGSLTIEGIICTGPAGPRLPYPIEVLHASILYALRGGTKPGVENQPGSFQGKRARVQGVTEGQEVVVCMNGKPQRIPYLTVSEIQPL